MDTEAPATPTPIVAPRRRGKTKRIVKQPPRQTAEAAPRVLSPEAVASFAETPPVDLANLRPDFPLTPLTPDAPERPSLRPSLRAEDPRAAAEARAAEIFGHIEGMDLGSDDFYFDKSTIPPGWSYEWKFLESFGKSNPAYDVALARTGWKAVPASRHPEMMPLDTHMVTIDRKGLRLMERPKAVTEFFEEKERRKAIDQVQHKQEQLTAAPKDHFERQNKDAALVKIKKSYEPMQIPTD